MNLRPIAPPPATSTSPYRPVLNIYLLEALSSISAILLLTGIFYYTHEHFGWNMRQNLMLASGFGCVCILGALSSHSLSTALGRRKAYLVLQVALFIVSALALMFQNSLPLILLLLAYSALSTAQWPVLESLVSHAASGEVLSKRLSVYNLDWSAANAFTLAISGTLMHYRPGAIFVVAAACHVVNGFVMFFSTEPAPAAAGHLDPEPQLLKVRKQALWLARIALPSTYIVVASLNAMMPSLPVMRSISTQWATLVGSVWFAARFAAFAALGFSSFWHTRPRLMLAAAALMLIAFLGVTYRPSNPALHLSPTADLTLMIIAQIFLGIAMGTIYSASLYFGMVLSEGSTEHGGYHEALIGAGNLLGPATALFADTLYPNQINVGITAVAGLIALTLIAAITTSRRTRKEYTDIFSPR